MNSDIKLVFECEDINKEQFDVEYSFYELINNLNRISKNGRIDKVNNMYIVDMREGYEICGSLKEHFESTCDSYCESMLDKEFEWMMDALVEKTKQWFHKKINNMK